MEMARGLDKGTEPESLRAYLFGIARRVSQAAWKRRYREREVIVGDFAPEATASPVQDDRVEAAREMIAALPPMQREILDLRFSQQLSYAEIAEALEIPIGTVRSRIHNAVNEVRQRMVADEEMDSARRNH